MKRIYNRLFLATLALVSISIYLLSSGVSKGTSQAASMTPVFEDASAALGVAEGNVDAWGLAVADWNNDGCDDLYVGRHRDRLPRLYRNGCDGPFVDEVWRLLENNKERKMDRHAVAFADYDGDGRQDLFISTGGGEGTEIGDDDQLYHQRSDGYFEDVAPAEGMTDRNASGRFGMWLDYDKDNDLDLFAGHLFRVERYNLNRNLLYRNDNGHFVKVSKQANINTAETANSGAVTDIDQDGDTDVLTVVGKKPSLYINKGNKTFERRGVGDFTRYSNMDGIAPADYDNDGDTDLFISRPWEQKSQLIRNNGGSFSDVSAGSGTQFNWGSSTFWFDVDNDGWLDLFLYRQSSDGDKFPNSLLINQKNGRFVDVAPAAGVTGPTNERVDRGSAIWGDFNRDGWVDLVMQSKDSVKAVQLLLNRSQNGNGWITLHLKDPGSRNWAGIGAKAWIVSGGLTQYREIFPHTATWSQSPAYLMVGVGSNPIIDTLRIRWPDGTEEIYNNVEINRHYLATKGGGLEFLPPL